MLNVDEAHTNHVTNKENSHQRIYFLICNACFWCASCIDIEKMTTKNIKYPYCDNARLKLTHIILSSDQKYVYTK
jgi:hypothetical protein